MQIDWFTVAAQIVNFAILVLVLQRVLYGRIVAAIERRRDALEQRFADADASRSQAQRELAEHSRQLQELTDSRDRLLDEARNAAEARRLELVEVARSEVAAQRRGWLESLRDEQDDLTADLQRRAARAVCTATREALRDLADEDLEVRALRTLRHRLGGGPEEGDARFQAMRAAEGPLTVRTSRELPARLRQRAARTLHRAFGDKEIEWQRDPALICGVELVADGRVLAWNVRDYLEGLDDDVLAHLRDRSEAATEASETAAEAEHREGAPHD